MSISFDNSLNSFANDALARRSKLVLWVVLVGVGVAELLTSLANVQLGMFAHAALLVGLTLRAALGREDAERRLTLGLALAPLIRLLSLSLPLANLPRLAWYPIVAVPLLLAAWVIIRQLRMSRAELGLRPGN